MVKFKSTDQVLKIIKNKDQIRNFGVIAHVDHGKTTMSDSLLAYSGIIAPSAAGSALAMDFDKEEQERGITIYQANVTLHFTKDEKEYVINMIDTPGHVDFSGRVIRSLRAIDGAVVVCDAVEGIMTQTETVTRMALEERVRPVLFINKVDRLIKELRLTPEKMQEQLANVVSNFNQLIDTYAEPEYRDKWKVSINDASVTFGSAKDRWAINVDLMKTKGIKFKDVIDAYQGEKVPDLVEKAPLADAVLGMVVKHHPAPHEAVKYRIPQIWKGDLDSDVGRALLACSDEGPTIMMVVNMVLDKAAGPVAIGRLFSGTIKDGQTVNIIDSHREGRIQSVNFFMGNQREQVGELGAGNIPALLGLTEARAGNTLSSVKEIQMFEGVKYVSEPVVQVAVEPKHPKDLPKLVDVLKQLTIEDPNLVVKIDEESGETIVADVMKEGPLCKEQMRDCKFTFTHFVPHEDTAHRGLSQLGPASRRACLGALLTAGVSVLEPTLAIEVRVPTDLVGNVATVLSGKRGKVLDMVQKGASSIVTGEIPASETFTLSEEMRGQTAGRATWNTSFKAWTEVPKSMLAAAVADIRKRKGLAPDPPPAGEFIDKE